MSGAYQALAEKLNQLDLASEPLNRVSMAHLEAVEGVLGVQSDQTLAASARTKAALRAIDALVALAEAPVDSTNSLESMRAHLQRQHAAREQLARVEMVFNNQESFGMHL